MLVCYLLRSIISRRCRPNPSPCLFLCVCAASVSEVLRMPKGGSVTLKITGHVEKNSLKTLEWSVNRITIGDYRKNKTSIIESYQGRAELDVDTLSLRLRNLVKNDSGHYVAAKSVEGKPDETVAEYHISVLGG